MPRLLPRIALLLDRFNLTGEHEQLERDGPVAKRLLYVLGYVDAAAQHVVSLVAQVKAVSDDAGGRLGVPGGVVHHEDLPLASRRRPIRPNAPFTELVRHGVEIFSMHVLLDGSTSTE